MLYNQSNQLEEELEEEESTVEDDGEDGDTVKTLYNALHYNAGFSIAQSTSSPKVESHSL